MDDIISCLSATTLLIYLENNTLTEDEKEALEEHWAHCRFCRRKANRKNEAEWREREGGEE